MNNLKSDEDIKKIAAGGQILSQILGELVKMVAPGAKTSDLDNYATARMLKLGGRPSFKGYKIEKFGPAFNGAVCTCLNDEVVHAPPHPSRFIKNGDMVKLDIGFNYLGLYTDMAVTVAIGSVSPEITKLIRVTREALMLGVKMAQPGGWVSDIGKAVDKHVRQNGFSTVKDLVGHGVGFAVHEEPRVPNYFDSRLEPVQLVSGMVLAIEPMVNMGQEDVATLADQWTVATLDGSLSAHFELTLAITANGPEILTPLPI